MREIKFRGKRKSGHEILIGDLAHINGLIYIFDDNQSTNSTDWFEVEADTIGQFTGLNDNNKSEIYEGDLLRSIHSDEKDGYFRVMWMNSKARFIVERFWKSNRGFTSTDAITAFDSIHYEVIGNIHQNPELL